jgi:hypothetical protein
VIPGEDTPTTDPDATEPSTHKPTTPLAFRVASAILAGVEACYEPELARLFACAYLQRGESVLEADELEAKLKSRFGKDFNLHRFRKGVKAIQEQIAAEARPVSGSDWTSKLIRKPPSFTQAAPCVTNALLYFDNHEAWAGNLKWNEFTGEPLVTGDLPIGLAAGEPVRDHHDTLVQSWFERETQDYKWTIDTVRRSADCWAKANSFHPVKDYLNGLPAHDGVPRLETWLQRLCGAGPSESNDSDDAIALNNFISAIGVRWWISMIARIFEPGCKVHHVLVLEGAKGIGKTTLAEIIFGEWYAVIVGDVTSKDNQALLSAGLWGVLMDELDVLGKSEMRSIKSWVTRDFEKFRPTWGHRHEKRPRQCVFIATVNGDDWALEEDRRWWPVACKKAFDLDGLRAERDLLMAEALHRYRDGQRWYLHPDEDRELIVTARQEQSTRVTENVNAVSFLSAAHACAGLSHEFPGTCSVEEIMNNLKVPLGRERFSLAPQCGKALTQSGWKRERPRGDDGVQRVRYRKPDKA